MACLKFKNISIVFSPISLLLLCFPYLSLSDLNSEKQALLDFANSVHHGPKLNWKVNTPVCSSWTGVTCSTDQTHVLVLRLPGVGLSGQIPPSTLGKLDHLQIVSLRNNHLSGSLPSDLPSLPSLRYLYLQKNALTGHLPDSFASGLKSLDLSYNLFSGEIPVGIQNLSQLVTLNLSNNSLSGPIPDLKLPSLRHLNLSNNNLNGSIPFSLQHFPNDTFVGNIQLCGPPLPQCSAVLPSPSPSPPPPLSPNPTFPQNNAKNSRKKLSKRIIIVIVAGGVALFLLLVIIIMLCFSKRKDRRGSEVSAATGSGGAKNEKPKVDNSSGVQMAEKNKLVFFDGCSYTFDLEDLLRASAEVLGKGSYGTAYKAALEDGTMVVVKRLKEVVAGKKEFEQQMEMIDRVGQHPNLAQIRAYYYSKDEKLLVYDYASASSFSTLLHGNRGGTERTPLDWDSRVRIVLGAAKGIAHIHSEGGAKFVHGNIKSSNILLSETHSPIVSDYGLAPLMNTLPATHSRVVVGYRAPEFIETRKPTPKSDVYSFGVLLLEVLTGKSPIQAPGYDDVVDLPRWVHSVVREEWTAEVFDMELMRYPNIEEEMVQMLQLGMACVSRTPDKRPNMAEVVRILEDIRRPDSESRPSSEARGSEGETTLSATMETKC